MGMQKRDQAVLAALVVGLLIGVAATYALAGSLSRTSTTTTLPAVTSTTTVLSWVSSVPDNYNRVASACRPSLVARSEERLGGDKPIRDQRDD
jgi:Ca2+/Na+ antiporter